ncbi:hypothetical protein CRG98_033158 [Punica granatum]|uniref:Uncharacterized protein n=1 Tax=Punica granatum TaxID=22663 RepID=A0A2I0IRZ9_PUNGR|nr:hypothetical protein CRG98_033158 [Punica granatum]
MPVPVVTSRATAQFNLDKSLEHSRENALLAPKCPTGLNEPSQGLPYGDDQVPTDLVHAHGRSRRSCKESDGDGLSRLMILRKPEVQSHIFPLMSEEIVAKTESDSGMG